MIGDGQGGGRFGVEDAVPVEVPFDLQQRGSVFGIESPGSVQDQIFTGPGGGRMRLEERLRRAIHGKAGQDGGHHAAPVALEIIDAHGVTIRPADVIIGRDKNAADIRAREHHFIHQHPLAILLPRQQCGMQAGGIRRREGKAQQPSRGNDGSRSRHRDGGGDRIRHGPAGVEIAADTEHQRGAVREPGVVVREQFWKQHAAQTPKSESGHVAVKVFVIPIIRIQAETLGDFTKTRAERRGTDAAERRAFKPGVGQALFQDVRPDLRNRPAVVKLRAGQVGIHHHARDGP